LLNISVMLRRKSSIIENLSSFFLNDLECHTGLGLGWSKWGASAQNFKMYLVNVDSLVLALKGPPPLVAPWEPH
jgi:hypothetical protein